MYIGLEEFKVLLLLWIALMLMFHSMSNKHSVKLASGAALTAALFTNIYMYSVFDQNTESFSNNKKLECHGGNIQHLVEKTNGWKQEKNYFIKDDLMIKIVDCKEF